MHCHTAHGWWAVELLQSTTSLPGGSEHRTSCNALPNGLGAVGSATGARTAALPRGGGQCKSYNALNHRPGAVGSGTPSMQCLIAWGE